MQHNPDSTPPVIIKHPESGLIDCLPPPPVCNGPCCGTCNAAELTLRKAGVRLVMTNEWVSDEYYYFQFAMTRGNLVSGTPSQCASFFEPLV